MKWGTKSGVSTISLERLQHLYIHSVGNRRPHTEDEDEVEVAADSCVCIFSEEIFVAYGFVDVH
jgi:hypothetical protein